MTKCGNPNCDQYPYYGMAPHKHKGVQWDVPRTVIGSTVIDPRESWPKNFAEDPECPGLGVWTCPECSIVREENSMQKPSVGRIVHILMPDDDNFEPVPAIILSVPPNEENPFVSLKVFMRDGTDSLVTARWSEEPKLGHWSWPPRV